MSHQVILHISGEVPIFGDVEELPNPQDQIIIVHNPRSREGKDLHYLQDDVIRVIWPIAKINFIEILDNQQDDQIFSFVRE